MVSKKNRIFLRIPLLVEAAAEGPFAILALFGIVLIVILTKSLQWW